MPFRLCCLVVDDHLDSARLLATILKYDGHHGVTASSVEEATRLVEQAPFDVLLTDLRLPDGSGWELLARLRQRHPRLIGIAVSGLACAADVDQSRAAGFALHLTKPIDVDQLRGALTAITRQIIHASAPQSVPIPAGFCGEHEVERVRR